MADPFIGNVMLVAFDYAPRFWQPCDGRLLAINQNAALFSLLGTQYGGNGTTNFALPDLRSRVPVGGTGQGPGLNNVQIGERAGVESVTVLAANIPAHTHTLNGQSGTGTTSAPGPGTVLARTVVDDGTGVVSYSSTAPNTALSAASVGSNTGGSTPIGIRNPYLGLQYIICVSGIFPSRN
jgi:microcystin-dependent protein